MATTKELKAITVNLTDRERDELHDIVVRELKRQKIDDEHGVRAISLSTAVECFFSRTIVILSSSK